ncbi:MAG: hypothetical protein ACRD0D_02370, partial [Acidimicrobiales bacterium]
MTRETRLQRLRELAEGPEPDEYTLNTEAIALGADLDGLALLVDRFGRSPNALLVRAVTFPLARAPWELSGAGPPLGEVVVNFLRATGASTDAGTLIGCATALQGLSQRRWLLLVNEDDRCAVLGFLDHCLSHTDRNVVGACIDLIGHLVADGTLDEAVPRGGREE